MICLSLECALLLTNWYQSQSCLGRIIYDAAGAVYSVLEHAHALLACLVHNLAGGDTNFSVNLTTRNSLEIAQRPNDSSTGDTARVTVSSGSTEIKR